MRQADVAGFDRERLIEEVTRRRASSARSPADVLAWRIERQIGEASPIKTSYVGRTPDGDDPRVGLGPPARRGDGPASRRARRASSNRAAPVGRASSVRCLPRPIRHWHGPSEPELSPLTGRRTATAPSTTRSGPLRWPATSRPGRLGSGLSGSWDVRREQRELAGATDAELASHRS